MAGLTASRLTGGANVGSPELRSLQVAPPSVESLTLPDSVPTYTVACGVVRAAPRVRGATAWWYTPDRPAETTVVAVVEGAPGQRQQSRRRPGEHRHAETSAGNGVTGCPRLAPPLVDTQTLHLVVAATTLSPSPGSTTMDCARAVGPEPVAVQAAPQLVLFQTRFSVAPYRTPGAAGEAASARTCAAEGPSAVQVFGGPAGAEKAEPANSERTTASAQMRRRITEEIGAPRPAAAPQKSVVDPAIDITATNTGARPRSR